MAKNQNHTKDIASTVLMIVGVLSIFAAVIINAVIIVRQVGWFGAAQLSDLGVAVTIFKENPVALITTLTMFFGGYIVLKVGTKLSK